MTRFSPFQRGAYGVRFAFSLIASASLFTLSNISAHAQSETPVPKPSGIFAKGPLPVRDYEPMNTLFLLPIPTDASVLDKGKKRFDFNIDDSNTLLVYPDKGYYIDLEEQRFTFGYAVGLGKGQELGVRLPYVMRNGGIFDHFLDAWHKTFNLMRTSPRRFLPYNRTILQIKDAQGGEIINETGSHSGLGDMVLEYRYALTPETDGSRLTDRRGFSATARALVKLPTGDDKHLLGSGNLDFGVGLAITARPWQRVVLHGNLSTVFVGDPRNKAIHEKPSQVHSMVGLEWLIDGRTSFVWQVDDNPAPHDSGIKYLDRARREFSYGFWRVVNDKTTLYLSMSENDFGLISQHGPDTIFSTGIRVSY